jgi:hypothetical protein
MVDGRRGETRNVPLPGGDLEVEGTAPVFCHPSGARIDG